MNIKNRRKPKERGENGQIWTKSKEIEGIPQFYHEKGKKVIPDGRKAFGPQSWGTKFLAHQNSGPGVA